MKRGNDEPPGDDDDDDVGYGKPPRRTRFRPGQSGNPGGRPKRALGKHQQLVAAMDQPTREMFLEEMNRAITVASDGKMIRMPTKRMIIRSMAKTAASGGQQAQRTAILLQLELERELARERAERLALIREVKETGEEVVRRCRARGIPLPPELVPHPDDIFIDEETQTVEIRGPRTAEQKVAFDKVLAQRDAYVRGFYGHLAAAKAKPWDGTRLFWAAKAQAVVDAINDMLPERYRTKLTTRMTPSEVEAAIARAQRWVQAQERRRARARAKRAALVTRDP